MYVSVPTVPEFGAKVDNWLRFLLTHELTHYVNMTIEKGLFYQLSRVLGEGVSSIPGGLMPGWAIEGIAVKLESDFTGGGRGNNPFFEMYSRALILEDDLFSWRQAEYSSYNPPLSRIYIAGYIINDYLARTYGNDIFVKIYKEYLNFPLLGFNHYVKKITGDPVNKIFEKMELELKEKYSNINSKPGILISPNIDSNYYLPVISQREWIVYRESVNKEPALVTMDPISKKETILVTTTLSDYNSFSSSADGNFIAFTALDINGNNPTGLNAISNLYLLDRKNKEIKRITTNGHIKQPVISSNGKRIVAIQKTGQNTSLVEVDIHTGNTKLLFEQRGSSIFNPDFSETGGKIVFTVQDTSGRNIFILDNKNTIKFLSPDIPGDKFNPLFMDTGNIVFVSDIEGTPSLYEIDMSEEKKLSKLFTDPVGIYSGRVHNNEIIYSTWSHRGYTLKSAPYVKHPFIEKENLFQISKEKYIYEPPVNIPNLENNNKYIDIPKLVAFSPIPFYLNPIYESTQIFGPGITGYFRSILGKSELFTTITLNTDFMQPGASVDFTYNWGYGSFNYSFLQGYSEGFNIYTAVQTTKEQLIFNFPLFNYRNLGRSVYFSLFTGLVDNLSLISNKDFPFFSPLPNSYSEYRYNAFLLDGFSFSLSGQKSRGDTFNPFNISSTTFFYTPVSSDFMKQYAVKSTNSINIPSPLTHQVFKFSSRITYSDIPNLQYLNEPRGLNFSSAGNTTVLTSAEYLFTMARPDWPIFGGLSIQGISGSLHLEKLFTIENLQVTADKNYYGGIELIFLGNYITAFESAGIGINYRFEPNTSSFNSSNLGVYLFIGTNSFD